MYLKIKIQLQKRINPTTHLLWQTLRRRGQQAEPALADGLHVGAVLLQPQGAHHHPAPEHGDFRAVQEVLGADHAGPGGALAAAVPAPRRRHAEVRAQRAAHDPPGDGLGHRRAAPYGGERHVRRIFQLLRFPDFFIFVVKSNRLLKLQLGCTLCCAASPKRNDKLVRV